MFHSNESELTGRLYSCFSVFLLPFCPTVRHADFFSQIYVVRQEQKLALYVGGIKA